MLRSIFSAAILAVVAAAAQAETIRFTFNTEADLSGTLANNSFSQNEAGFYPGVITTTRGLNAAVIGYIDIQRVSGQMDVVLGFALNVVTPHGVAPGFGFPDYQTQFFSEVDMSVGGGGASEVFSSGGLILTQVVQFDPFYGPASILPRYDPSVRQTYPFQQRVQFQSVPGRGPDGGPSYAVGRVDFNCYEYPTGGGGANGCNGYYLGNSGSWYQNSGLAASFGPAPEGPPSVPLPAGLPLLLAGLGALILLRRRVTRSA